MKKLITTFIISVLCALTLFAQAPEKFSYQAVVRNASNALVTNAPVGVRVSILQGSASGNAVYVETHTASTNANGLLTVEIGGGTVQQGSFAGINWANGPFFLKTETDPAGGTNYTVTSTQQLMSVPYALYAEEAGNGFSGDYNDLTNKPTIPQNVGDLTNNVGYVTQNDLPTVPTNVSAFINDAGYVTMDSIPAQVNADWNATEGVAEILNKPVNSNFGHGIVFTKVNNAAGVTDITVGFTNYTLMTGGVVSLSFTNDVPAGATLNINNQGAKPIHYRGPALTAGVIKANDRCLFMYNATAGRYYLLANDRWGVDVDALATVAHTGSYNDLTDKPTIPTVPTNISAFVNDAGYITAIPDSFGGISLETDPIFSAWNKDYNDLTNKPNLAPVATSGDYNDLTNKPNLAPVATSGDYNDLTNKPTIPTVPTNISAFVNDAGYITAIPDSFGGISLETDPIFSAWNKDYNDLINKPNLAPVATSGDYNDLTNKPTNADFGQGIVRTKVNNASGATDIAVTFTGYQLVTGGVVSLAFQRNVPAGATLNINNKGAQPIYYKDAALAAGVIKAGDRCLFMYNSGAGRYYLLAIDRWGADLDGLATVAHTGSYNDLTDKPTIPTVPTDVSAFNNDAGYITQDQVPAQVNADWNATNGPAQILNKPTIPTVPTNISAFVNDMGYITAIPDSLGGISIESDPVFSAWDKDYNDLTNRPELFSGDYNDLTNKPVNADFGQGIVRTNVTNAAGATDINVTFTGYQLVTGGVVSLGFKRNVPAGATLNINNQGAKPIYYKGEALAAGVIKANDRCLFMYNSGANAYYLLANDRWGSDIEALATVAHTGDYNDLINKPTPFSGDYNDLTNTPDLAPVATSGDYNDLTNTPTVPTNISAFNNDAGYITQDQVPAQVNADWNATEGAAQILNKPDLAPVATSGDYNDLTNTPVNADFGQGLVRTNVSNASGATDIAVTFTGYQLVTGGVVSLGFKRNVPAGATLNINNQGAKPILYKGTALTAGVIKANDRCLFMYNSGGNAYYLLAIDRWGVDLEALATVAHTGSYNDLTDKPNLAPVATSGNYNDLTNTPTIPTVPTNVGAFDNDAGYITADDVPAQVNADWNATEGAAKILNKPELAPVATSGNYNDLTNTPTIPTVPTHVSAFINDMGYLTSIPDSFGGISIENDPIFTAWGKDYNDLVNRPNLAPVATSGDYNDLTNKPNLKPVATSGDYNDLTNKPTNADFGQGIVRTKVNNASGATDIAVTFTGYQLETGGVVSLAFQRNVPAGATLNINNKGAQPIYYKDAALAAGVIKAGDRCLFMYNSGAGRYFLLANDRWGDDLEALATVAHTGSYNDLVDKPTLATVATTGNYNDLVDKPELFSGNYNDLTDKPDLFSGDYNDLTNKPTNATFGQGIVRQSVSNAVGATDISVTFTNYALETGGIVSLAFVNNVPAGATLNINNKGAKPIYYKDAALTAGVIKAGDRCLFMYNSGAGRYYLLANDRWGTEFDALATVAHTGNYSDLNGTPPIPTRLSDLENDAGFITMDSIPAQVQSDWEETDSGSPAFIKGKPDMNQYLTAAAMSDYVTTADLSNFVTKTENETVGGNKDFTGHVTVTNSGSIEVPSVLSSISTTGDMNLSTTVGTGDCKQAVNFCDLETVYQNMLNKFNELNDQIDDLLDSINKLNEELNTPQDGAPCPTSPTVTDNSGYTYSTVRIGNQCWTRENMRGYTGKDHSSFTYGGMTPTYNTSDAYYIYPNTNSDNQVQYGKLYNYPAASLICPDGWRLPSSADWNELRSYVEANYKIDGDVTMKALAFTEGWQDSDWPGDIGYQQETENNKSGFSVKPAGMYPFSTYYSFGDGASFWTSDKKIAKMHYYNSVMYIGNSNSTNTIGSTTTSNDAYMSVRCIRKSSNGETSTIKPMTVETNEPNSSNITNVSVVSGSVSLTIKPGTITSNDSMPPATNILRYGFVYSHTVSSANSLKIGASNVNSSNYTTLNTSNQPTAYPFEMTSYNLTGLTSGDVYYYRAYAIRGSDTVYGAVKHFTAQSDPNSCKKLGSGYPEHVEDASGYSYSTVAIGSQCWLAQSLRTIKYSDNSTVTGGCYYAGGNSADQAKYGLLYTWAAAMRGTDVTTLPIQGVCPTGWHMPTSDEFQTMKSTLQENTAMQCNSSSNIARALASTTLWDVSSVTCAPGNNQSSNNASGFSVYPAGLRDVGGNYQNKGKHAYLLNTSSWVNILQYDDATVTTNSAAAAAAFTVRCVYGDAAPTVSTGTATFYDVVSTSSHYYASDIRYKFTVTGTVHSTGGISITERGICYAPATTTTTPTTYNSKVTSSGGVGSIDVTLEDLVPGNTYYYRAYAKNSKGTTYGEAKSFVAPAIATVTTISVYSYTNTTAVLGGSVTSTGNSSYVTIESRDVDLRTAAYPNGSYVNYGTVSGGGSGTYYVSVSGLTPGTTYYAVANVYQTVTIDGHSKSFYVYANNNASFIPHTRPAISTTNATYSGDNQTGFYYTFTGNLTNAGSPTITQKGFVWSDTYTTNMLRSGRYDHKITSNNTSTGSFSLGSGWFTSPNTTWYYCAYAVVANVDTVYGTVYSFKTHDYPSIALAENYADQYYYSSEVTKNKIRVYPDFTATSSSSTSGGCSELHSGGVVYSTSPITLSSSGSHSTAPSSFGTVVDGYNASYYITGLSSNTVYYIRAWARSAAGYSYSPQRVIRTAIDCSSSSEVNYSTSAARKLHDQDGNTYGTIKIGSLCWMHENLKARHYDNTLNQTENGSGTTLTVMTGTTVSQTTPYAYCPAGSIDSVSKYGYLYNWTASANKSLITTSSGKTQGICPRGWHLPTYSELSDMKSRLSTASYWGTSYFNPQYAGITRGSGASPGTPLYFGTGAHFWGDEYNSYPYALILYNTNFSASVGAAATDAGRSVRCVQDVTY